MLATPVGSVAFSPARRSWRGEKPCNYVLKLPTLAHMELLFLMFFFQHLWGCGRRTSMKHVLSTFSLPSPCDRACIGFLSERQNLSLWISVGLAQAWGARSGVGSGARSDHIRKTKSLRSRVPDQIISEKQKACARAVLWMIGFGVFVWATCVEASLIVFLIFFQVSVCNSRPASYEL